MNPRSPGPWAVVVSVLVTERFLVLLVLLVLAAAAAARLLLLRGFSLIERLGMPADKRERGITIGNNAGLSASQLYLDTLSSAGLMRLLYLVTSELYDFISSSIFLYLM